MERPVLKILNIQMGPYHQILGLGDTWQKEENEIEEKEMKKYVNTMHRNDPVWGMKDFT